MKNRLIICVLLCLPLVASATDFTETTESSTKLQLRVGADFSKSFNHGLELSLSEELRLQMYPMSKYTVFARNFTTLDFSYKPIPYLKLDVGYMLKIVGCSKTKQTKWDNHWSDPNEYIRHRAFGSVTGIYKTGNLKLTLRERVLCDIRTDEVDPLEKNNYDWLLRSKIGAEYSVKSVNLKPYLWLELENTLNAPEYQRKNGHQYISQVRTCVGVKYKLNKHNDLNFFYRLDYGYDRDVDISDSEITIKKTYTNAIGFTYSFDW